VGPRRGGARPVEEHAHFRGGQLLSGMHQTRLERLDPMADLPTADVNLLGFMIDGAVAKARTGAFFSNGQAILTSRTVSHISQSTITQREVEANPNSADPLVQGPGYVAPVGIGGQFPPGILRRPLVDLFAIEHTNRVSVLKPGISPADPFDPANFIIDRRSYSAQVAGTYGAVGSQAGQGPQAIARGISTMPGGLGIYRDKTNELIGGIGVFFPGRPGTPEFGTATFEQAFIASPNQTRTNRLNAPKALEAEAIATATLLPIAIADTATPLVNPAGDKKRSMDSPVTGLLALTLAPQLIINRAGGLTVPLPAPLTPQQAQVLVNRVNAAAAIYLGGIALQSFGPQAGPLGVQTLFNIINAQGFGTVYRDDRPVAPGGVELLAGQAQPDGWLVPATSSVLVGGLTAAQVKRIIDQGIAQATKTRAQIRVQPTFAKMVLAVADRDGTLLGVYRMPDATVFSIDVAMAKSRNTAYYASADLQPQDRVGAVPLGTAFTNRTFRYLAVPKYPSGNASAAPGPFSILNTPGINPRTGLNVGGPLPASAFTSTVLGYDSFTPGSNFRATTSATNQNGIVFFPGSTAVYVGGSLQGGYGISGDGVDQDDVVTFYGAAGFSAPLPKVASQFFVRGIRLPYIKFSRNAMAGV
ncbi:MAG: hypothetical protein ACKOHK_02590, partial [Planctomycetia bacterium]